MDPVTGMIIATAVASAAKAGGDALSGAQQKRAAKRRAKETKRETHADLMNSALQRSAELEAHRMGTTQKLNKRRTTSAQETADLLRGAFNI